MLGCRIFRGYAVDRDEGEYRATWTFIQRRLGRAIFLRGRPMKKRMERLDRAMEALIETHGRNAGRVAERRAVDARLGGSDDSAVIWRQIANAIQRREASVGMCLPARGPQSRGSLHAPTGPDAVLA